MLPMLIGVVALTAVSVTPGLAAAPQSPTKPGRIPVPYPPGGTTDPPARAVSNWFAEKRGTTFV
ncbi:MAG: tripartite tricarboxylate transporter substrate binding protein, partial [Betaproteobacteria bacterium]